MRSLIVSLALALAAAGAFSIAADGEPDPRADVGRGERLALVVGGEFPTRSEASAAAGRWTARELDGFFVAPSAMFDGMTPGRWLLVSAFRTQRGADEFAELAHAAGFPDTRTVVARYLGDAYIGLGQEPNPDGRGPLMRPLPPGHPAWLG